MIWTKKNSCPVRARPIAFSLSAVLLAACLTVGTFQGMRGLYETTEGRYAECAREMMQSGSWLEPVLNGNPHWTKPPLTYLAIGGGYMVFGPTAFAARFYLIPFFLLAVWGVSRLAQRLWRDPEAARLSAVAYATMAAPLFATQCVSTDLPLAAVVALSQAAFWDAFRTGSRRSLCLTWGLLGVAFLIKGPPALLYLPAMAVTWRRLAKFGRPSPGFFSPAALVLFFVVAAGWYVWEAWKHPGLMSYWLKDEVVERSLSDKFNRHPAFYMNFVLYLPLLVFGTLPWGAFLLLRYKRVARAVREKAVVCGRGLWSGLTDETLWLVWSTVFPMAVFALSRSKLPLYVLPLFASFAAAEAKLMLEAYRQERWFGKAVRMTCLTMCVAFVLGKVVYAHYPSRRDMGALHRVLVEKAGIDDPRRLACWGQKALNGLSYYYETVIPTVDPTQLAEWAAGGGERYLLADDSALKNVREILTDRQVDETFAFGRRRVLRIAAAASAGNKERGYDGTRVE